MDEINENFLEFKYLYDDDSWHQTYYFVLKKNKINIPFRIENLNPYENKCDNHCMEATLFYKNRFCHIDNIILTFLSKKNDIFNIKINFTIDSEIISDWCYVLEEC